MRETAAQRLAKFSSGLSYQSIPGPVVAAAKLHLLDTLGAGLVAHGLGVAEYARRGAMEPGVVGGASVIGLEHGVPSADAALANGTTCHAMDFDDTHAGAIAHVSTVVVPAALAAAEENGSSGPELLVALLGGNETVARLGAAVGDGFHQRGFHPTSICGVFGAAIAAARLRGLDAATTAHALGIAGSMTSGILEFLSDGSDTKPILAGWAAHAGIIAARLAAHGATGPATVIEGRDGLYGAFLDRTDIDLEPGLAGLGTRWETPEIAFKPFPACHFIHAPLDALRQLMLQQPIDPDEVEEIVAFTTTAGVALVLEPLVHKRQPRTEYEAKFSLPYSIASLILRGSVDISTYTGGAIFDPEVLSLAARVRYEVKTYTTFPRSIPGGIRITTRDGRVREAEVLHQRGGSENPMTPEDVHEKFRSNAAFALETEPIEKIKSAIVTLEEEGDLGKLRILRTARPTARAAMREAR